MRLKPWHTYLPRVAQRFCHCKAHRLLWVKAHYGAGERRCADWAIAACGATNDVLFGQLAGKGGVAQSARPPLHQALRRSLSKGQRRACRVDKLKVDGPQTVAELHHYHRLHVALQAVASQVGVQDHLTLEDTITAARASASTFRAGVGIRMAQLVVQRRGGAIQRHNGLPRNAGGHVLELWPRVGAQVRVACAAA